MTTEALQYCHGRVCLPGSLFNLSLQFSPPQLRERTVVIQALVSDISAIPSQVSEAEIAASKLSWWRQEVQRLDNGQPEHPVTRALRELGLSRPSLLLEIDKLISSIAASLDPRPLPSADALLEHCRQLGGRTAWLEAKALGAGESFAEYCMDLGAGRHCLHMVRDLAIDAQAGRYWLPMDYQARFQLTREQLQQRQISAPAWTELVLALLEPAAALLQPAALPAGKGEVLPLQRLLIQSALDRRLLQLLRRKPMAILQTRQTLNPWSALLSAWRAGRRVRRK